MEIKAVNYSYNSSVVTETQFKAHITLYNGYVTKINEIDKALAENPDRAASNAVYSKFRGLKKGETYSLNGIILHEEYFSNITKGGTEPGETTQNLIDSFFGSRESFLADFTAVCLSARGWCLTIYDQRTKRLRNIVCDSHDDGVVVNSYPIIVMDMYEHAYFYDYLTDKKSYIQSFIQGLNWNVVESRAKRLAPLLSKL